MATWYVSKTGNNTTGTSYVNGWTDFDQINRGSISTGDTIIIDGGSTRCNYTSGYDFINHATARPGLLAGMVYTSILTWNFPINVIMKASSDVGHNGTVVHFGGRLNLLPEANVASYTNGGGVGAGVGVDFRGSKYATIDGVRRNGWITYGWGDDVALAVGHSEAFRFDSLSDHVTLRNIEWFDCGTYTTYARPSDSATVYKTNGTGCNLGGTYITIDRCLGHDCGQDPIQGTQAGSNLVIKNSWFYGRRAHSTWTGYGFNSGCQLIADQNTTHVDGIQFYAGGLNQGPIEISYCVFGPMLNQGIYLGDAGIPTSFNSVNIHDCTFLGIFRHAIQGDVISSTTPANWTIARCTMHSPSTAFPNYSSDWNGVEVESGPNHSLTSCIITWNGVLYNLASFTGLCTNNVYSGTNTLPGGTNVDPLFRNALAPTNNTPTFTQILALDVTPTAALAVGKGSPVYSIPHLMALIDLLNGNNNVGRPRLTSRTQLNTGR